MEERIPNKWQSYSEKRKEGSEEVDDLGKNKKPSTPFGYTNQKARKKIQSNQIEESGTGGQNKMLEKKRRLTVLPRI